MVGTGAGGPLSYEKLMLGEVSKVAMNRLPRYREVIAGIRDDVLFARSDRIDQEGADDLGSFRATELHRGDVLSSNVGPL